MAPKTPFWQHPKSTVIVIRLSETPSEQATRPVSTYRVNERAPIYNAL